MFVAISQSDLFAWWAPALAFVAGVVSCASPCVFPLVPGYLSFVTGSGGGSPERRPVAPVPLFFLGVAVVFSALGGVCSAVVPAGEGGNRAGGGRGGGGGRRRGR